MLRKHLRKITWLRKIYWDTKQRIRLGKMKKNNVNVANEVFDIMSSTSIKYHIGFGTLLGFVREGYFIQHDLDIDFCIYDYNDVETLASIFKKQGFSFLHCCVYEQKIVEFTVKKMGISIDFFVMESSECIAKAYTFLREYGVQYPAEEYITAYSISISLPNGLEQCEVGGVKVVIPCNSKIMLRELYGENWSTPNPNWSFKYMPTLKKLDSYGVICKSIQDARKRGVSN